MHRDATPTRNDENVNFEPPTPKSVLKGEPPTPWRPHSVAPGLIQDLTVHEVIVENSLGLPRPLLCWWCAPGPSGERERVGESMLGS